MHDITFFSGGDKFDIWLVHGAHSNEPNVDMWEIVDLVNNCEELKIIFPSPEEQKHIAEGFRRNTQHIMVIALDAWIVCQLIVINLAPNICLELTLVHQMF